VDDLWYASKRGPDGERVPTKRHGRGHRWRVRFTDPEGKELTRSFDKRSDAEQFDTSTRADVARGAYVDLRAGQETVQEYATRWLAAQLHRASTADRVGRTLRLHVYPVLGRLQLAAVRPSHVQAWVKGLDLAPGTVRVAFSVLATVFAAAVRDRAVGLNPCDGVTLPHIDRADLGILTPAQVRRAADVMPARYRALVWIGAGCGLRVSEALGLERLHVAHLRRELTVSQQIAVLPGKAPHLAPPKTRTSKRTVELPSVVGDAVARLLELHEPTPQEITDATDPRKVHTRAAELLFTNERGGPLTRSAFSHIWRAAREDAELPAGTTFHHLRHYYASLLIAGGASVKTVQAALGHASPMITLTTYVGLWPDQIDRTRNLVDAAFREVSGAVAQA
jgi:integrase